MKLDRNMQLIILTTLSQEYPNEMIVKNIPESSSDNFQANLFYLSEHNLIKPVAVSKTLSSPTYMITAKITAEGLDFLADDGGLGAILNAITVKFDAENIKTILEDKIISSNLSEEQKKTLTEKIKNFTGEALKTIAIKLIEKGIEHPEILFTLIPK